MGYQLQAIICKDKLSNIITHEYKSAGRVHLKDNLYIIPFTQNFYDEVNQYSESNHFDKFEYLNERLFNFLSQKSLIEPIAYVEADYFGGTGGQSAIMFEKSKIIIDIRYTDTGYGAINSVLKEFGISKENNNDEWDTVGLLRHRKTEDWLEESNH